MKQSTKIKKKNEQIKEAKKIKRKIVNEGEISKVSFDVELSRGDMALIANSLNWSKDSSWFKMMPNSYKSKHNKLLDIFVDEIEKSRTL